VEAPTLCYLPIRWSINPDALALANTGHVTEERYQHELSLAAIEGLLELFSYSFLAPQKNN
jgi:hypothetical protein